MASCSFSVANEYLSDYLREAEHGGSEAEIRIPLRVGLVAREPSAGLDALRFSRR